MEPRDVPSPHSPHFTPFSTPFRDAISAARPTNNPAPQTRRRWLSGERTPALNPPSASVSRYERRRDVINSEMGVFDPPEPLGFSAALSTDASRLAQERPPGLIFTQQGGYRRRSSCTCSVFFAVWSIKEQGTDGMQPRVDEGVRALASLLATRRNQLFL